MEWLEKDMSKISNTAIDPKKIALDFPVLQQQSHGKPLTYLDTAASSQKPQAVIDAISHYYSCDNANVHRGVYELSQRATDAYDASRTTVRHFIHAQHDHEIIFTKGTTEAINLVAHSYGQAFVEAGDEIIVSTMEHHSNIVPWQLLCQRTGAILKVIRLHSDGSLDLDHFRELLSPKTKMLAVIHVSNVLGTVNPVKTMIAEAHQLNVPVLLDAAQSVPHSVVDVQELDCDFLVFSAQKLYGPSGVGVLYAKERWLNAMPPYQSGGDMIRTVSFEKTDFNELPYKFEAGTPNMAGVIGMAAAMDYINQIGLDKIADHESQLMSYGTQQLNMISGLTIIGNAAEKAGVISFVMRDIHPHDIGTILDSEGIAIRVGHHCAMPLMNYLGVPATARASFGAYSQQVDIDRLCAGLLKVKDIFDV
jgi:cysteine desulfurase / selenocysteine lyase